jgi:hypothetical protein
MTAATSNPASPAPQTGRSQSRPRRLSSRGTCGDAAGCGGSWRLAWGAAGQQSPSFDLGGCGVPRCIGDMTERLIPTEISDLFGVQVN